MWLFVGVNSPFPFHFMELSPFHQRFNGKRISREIPTTRRSTLLELWKLKKKFLEDISPFWGTTDTPALDFWWRLSRLLKPGWIFTCMLGCLCATESSDSPLMWHLLTSWQPAWHPSRPNEYTCEPALVEQSTRLVSNKVSQQLGFSRTILALEVLEATSLPRR